MLHFDCDVLILDQPLLLVPLFDCSLTLVKVVPCGSSAAKARTVSTARRAHKDAGVRQTTVNPLRRAVSVRSRCEKGAVGVSYNPLTSRSPATTTTVLPYYCWVNKAGGIPRD